MSAAAVLDPPADVQPGTAAGPAQVFRGPLLDLAVAVEADGGVPVAALGHLLTQMAEQWDVRRRRSDLARVSNHPGVMVAVSPLTLLLVRDVLTAVHLAECAGVAPGVCHGAIDARHSRVGLDPTAAALCARLVPAAAADLLADFCRGHGATTGQVRVGAVVRVLGDPVPTWLLQVATDLGQAHGHARGPQPAHEWGRRRAATSRP